MIDLTTFCPEAQASLALQRTTESPIDRTLLDVLVELLRQPTALATLERLEPGTDPGLLVIILNGQAMSTFGPPLSRIAWRAMRGLGAESGRFDGDQTARIGEILAWLDATPRRCAHGMVTLGAPGVGPAAKAYIFGFTGAELCESAREALGGAR